MQANKKYTRVAIVNHSSLSHTNWWVILLQSMFEVDVPKVLQLIYPLTLHTVFYIVIVNWDYVVLLNQTMDVKAWYGILTSSMNINFLSTMNGWIQIARQWESYAPKFTNGMWSILNILYKKHLGPVMCGSIVMWSWSHKELICPTNYKSNRQIRGAGR